MVAGAQMVAPRLAHAATVEVDGARVTLADVLPGIAAPWRDVDVGQAPPPLADARLTADQVINRLAALGLPPPPGFMPRAWRVVRRGQAVSRGALERLARQQLVEQLPPASFVGEVRVRAGVSVPPGPVRVTLDVPYDLPPGPHTRTLGVHTGDVAQGSETSVAFDLRASGRDHRVPVLERGSPVTVLVLCGNVVVHTGGSAQEAGSIGDVVAVLPQSGSRVLRGRIVDGQTVQVQL